MGSLPNKISEEPVKTSAPTFERSLVYSILFHGLITVTILGFAKFNVDIFKKPPPEASVVWTQTVKRKQPTMKDKLPAPLVPLEKPQEVKKEEINVKKDPVVKPTKEDAKDKMKKALEALKNKVAPEDDRPVPKEDNFATADKENPAGILSDSEVLAIQNSSEYGAYLALVKQTVTDNFIWYKTGINFVTVVSMKIDGNGNVNNAKVEKSSGDFAFDQAVLRAVQKSNPLPPPPEKVLKLVLQDYFELEFKRTN